MLQFETGVQDSRGMDSPQQGNERHAEGNVNDLVWEYGSIHHSWMYPGN